MLGGVFARPVHYLAFFADPPVVEEFDARLPIAASPQGWPGDERPLKVGDWISLRGVYRDGTLHPTLLVHHQKSSDLLLSALAGAIFVLLWLPSPMKGEWDG